MPKRPYETEVNSETPLEELLWCINAAEHTRDPNTQRTAAKAQVEVQRREQQKREERFNAESRERVKALRIQEKLVDRQIEAQEKWMGPQLEVAKDQAKTARGAERAAKWSAVAAVAIVVLTAILAFVAARPLFAPYSSDMPAATTAPATTKSE